MTSQMTVKLSRGDNTSWGFRLQGGKDFSTPLSVQRVNPGSLAEKAGIVTGDAILKIMGKSTETMKHKEAQDSIIRGGNNLEIVLQRGGIRVWKPTVTPIGDIPTTPTTPVSTQPLYTQTSLAAKKQEFQPIGSKHNVSAKPFGGPGPVMALVHNQYNSPAPIYSMNSIAETLSAHTEVLASGAKGINFMKEPQPVNKESAVYRMLMEEEKTGKGEDTESAPPDSNNVPLQSKVYRRLQHALGDENDVSPSQQTVAVTKSVAAPITKPPSEIPQRVVDQNACTECGKPLIGVFVKIKDKSMHPECFRCSTCGTPLKNVGYYRVNDKLYCEIHTKQAAMMMSGTPVVEPLVVSQLPDAPSAVSPPPSDARAPTSPTFDSMSPVPFHRQSDLRHVEAPTSPQSIRSPPVFKPNVPFSPTSTSPTFKPGKLISQAPSIMSPPVVPSSVMSPPVMSPPVVPASVTSPPVAPPAGGSKFVWPPPKVPQSEPVPISNATPSLPSYRPPPGTQHVAPAAKFSPPSYLPSVTSKSPPPSSQRTPPAPAPKPHTPVQSIMATAPGTPSWASTSLSATSSSTGMMTAGTGSRPAPRRGRGQLKQQAGPGARIPICGICGTPIRGPFVTALGKTWCPDHFLCANNRCQRSLADVGFVEEQGQLYCENCYEKHLAPICAKCGSRIKGDCLNALDKQWHPDCFLCAYCHKPFGNSSFYMEDGRPYCEKDWNELFTTKCVGCGFPIEAGDRWVEALNNNYHSQCFKCTICHKNLEGQSFYAKGGRPFCKAHAR